MKFFRFNRHSGEAELVEPSKLHPSRPRTGGTTRKEPKLRSLSATAVTAEAAGRLGQPKADIDAALGAVLAIVTEHLKMGQPVQLPGFGLFKPRRPMTGRCRNPRTGAAVDPPGRKSVCFKAAPTLKAAVNSAT